MNDKPKVLLHICCAPDSTAVTERLAETYTVVGFFHNPNIHPAAEYQRRAQEAEKVASRMGFEIIIPEYNADEWMKFIKGLEQEPEKGKRCEKCFEFNLNATAAQAKVRDIPFFTTTLTISPHKRSEIILELGRRAGLKENVQFLAENFKKKEGFKRSLTLSHEMDLYRQKYCGCKYSLRVNDYA